jgi:hypothetical protein
MEENRKVEKTSVCRWHASGWWEGKLNRAAMDGGYVRRMRGKGVASGVLCRPRKTMRDARDNKGGKVKGMWVRWSDK